MPPFGWFLLAEGPKPLRTTLQPDHIDGLQGVDKLKVEKANQLYDATIVFHAHSLDICVAVDNPSNSHVWNTTVRYGLACLWVIGWSPYMSKGVDPKSISRPKGKQAPVERKIVVVYQVIYVEKKMTICAIRLSVKKS